MAETIKPIPGAPVWLARAINQLNAGCPLFHGKLTDAHFIPRPGNLTLAQWLKSSAPEEVKEYCRASLRFYKANPELKPEWIRRLENSL